MTLRFFIFLLRLIPLSDVVIPFTHSISKNEKPIDQLPIHRYTLTHLPPTTMSLSSGMHLTFDSKDELLSLIGESRYCVVYEYSANGSSDVPITLTHFGTGSSSLDSALFPITSGDVIVYDE